MRGTEGAARGHVLRRAATILGLFGAVIILAKYLRSYLATCDLSGSPTFGSLTSFMDLALTVGSRGKESLRSPAALFALAFVCLIAGFHAVKGRGMPWAKAATAVLAIALLVGALVLRDLGRLSLAIVASTAAAIVVALHPETWKERWQEKASRLRLVAAWAAVALLAVVSRLYGLAEHPRGYAEHAVVHNLIALPYYEELLSPPMRLHLSGLWHSIMAQFGLQSLLEAIWFKLVGVGFLQSTFLPALLGVGAVMLGYSFGHDLLGKKGGFFVSYLFALGSWQIAFSRYGDPEHILPVFQAALTLALGVKALRTASAGLALLAGMSLGLSWFVYGTNQILPVIVLACLGQLLFLRRYRSAAYYTCGAAFVGGFLLVSGEAFYRNLASGHIYPIRAALPDNANYRVVSLAETGRSLPKAYSELMRQATDPWFSKQGGMLSDLEAVLLIPSLAIGAVALLRGVDRDVWCFLFTAAVLSPLPAIASPEVNCRRLLLSAFFCSCVVAAGAVRMTGLLEALFPRTALAVLAGLAVSVYACAALNTYSTQSRQEHSESHAQHTAVARFISRHANEASFKVFQRSPTDAAVQYGFIRLQGYDRLRDVRSVRPNAHLRYTFHPEALPVMPARAEPCAPGSLIVIADDDEEIFRRTIVEDPELIVHGYGCRPADPGHSGEYGADDHRADGQPARHRPHPAVHQGVKVIGHSRSFQNHRHKDKERNGQQGKFPHGCIGLGCDQVKAPVSPEKIRTHHPYASQDKSQGKAQSQEQDEGSEEQNSD